MTGADQTVEYYRQLLIWGEVQFDASGNVVPRELPEPWASLQGTRRYGRGATAVNARIEGSRAAIAWLDEHVRFLAEGWQDPHKEVRELVSRTPLTPPPATVPAVGTVRWSYRAHPPRFGTGSWFEAEASDILSGKSSIDQLVEKIRSIQLERAREKGLV